MSDNIFMPDAPASRGVTPVRLRRSRAKGARLVSPNGLPIVCVTRPGRYGNPFKPVPSVVVNRGAPLGSGALTFDHNLTLAATTAVLDFARWLTNTPDGKALAKRAQFELRGCNLACYCPLDKPCHADVLLKLANTPEPK